METNNYNEPIITNLKKLRVRRVTMFMSKSILNNRRTYVSKIYLQSGQTKMVKEVFASSFDELQELTKKEMNRLVK